MYYIALKIDYYVHFINTQFFTFFCKHMCTYLITSRGEYNVHSISKQLFMYCSTLCMFSFCLKGKVICPQLFKYCCTLFMYSIQRIYSSTLKVDCYVHLIRICTIVYVLLHFWNVLNWYELKKICVFNDMPITKIVLSIINVKLSITYLQ